ncbi:Dihydroneopterin aldolase-domain-containing protein [Xylariales sp. AK1849]|nr:Dihydroneopterin aldolase-domain-containing protein [Xylariales sp. AK1849]
MLSSLRSWVMSDPKPDPPAPLLTTWEVAAAAGEPFAVVRVRNLQGTIPVGRDAWGRANKLQPALISTEVSFTKPFGTAAADDKVSAETAHYGNLSKNLMGGLELWNSSTPPKDPKVAEKAETEGPTSADVFELLWVGLTGRVVDGSQRALPLDRVPFLDTGRLRSLSLTVKLPKASLVGTGVSLTVMACFKEDDDKNPQVSYARSLRIHELHVPTLIGVNSNERKAKQMVVADIEIDRLDIRRDIHPEVERLITETMEASSFETLEALGAQLADRILSDFKVGDDPKSARERGWQVKISLGKPIAVPFADSPEVVIRAG